MWIRTFEVIIWRRGNYGKMDGYVFLGFIKGGDDLFIGVLLSMVV